MTSLTSILHTELPIIQAPMAGVSTPAMAAAVSNAGALGSIAVGASSVDKAQEMIRQTRALTSKPFNVNLFCHRPAVADSEREAAWLQFLAPVFAEFDATPPAQLQEIYTSFVADQAMLAMLLEERPAIVSFHFGLPDNAAIQALKQAGIILLACATTLEEARQIEAAGVDIVVAQGVEAGGHRGVFTPEQGDHGLGTLALVRQIVSQTQLPVVAAGGIMDGHGIKGALALGAQGVQMGTAFVLCPESSANAAYRAAMQSDLAYQTRITSAISGRPARGLPNRFYTLGEQSPVALPDYPNAYDAGKALHAAASAQGSADFAAQWAGQGAPLARALPAAELVAMLAQEAALTR
ncbi:2-nitropropane dioxygenase [Pokkaliibacter plantistimulans]|uniref:Propionate 3-nitronate monooxygenase n=1 Tax=Pokkaliibacter plantistimulans TaxID=1635171 RepID=A0ABX5M346_9GAMM|nr:nitronate monooxygenase [Pokkaliibacter plantistimulans]PXF32804.1 2-nitropropane dioxygenase [Pokkaliibacter plantistimulans]